MKGWRQSGMVGCGDRRRLQHQDHACTASRLRSCEDQSAHLVQTPCGDCKSSCRRLGSVVPQPIQFGEGKVAAKVANVVADV